MRALWLIVLIALFSGLGVFGYRFIHEVSTNAEKIDGKIQAHEPPKLPMEALNKTSGIKDLNTDDFTSSEDNSNHYHALIIEQGDFSMLDDELVLRLKIHNQSNFSATSFYLSAFLYEQEIANSAIAKNRLPKQAPLVQSENLAVLFNAPLSAGETRIVSLPLKEEIWQTVQEIPSKIFVKIILVTDGDQDNIEYAQTTAGVWLQHLPPNHATVSPLNNSPQPSLPPSSNESRDTLGDFIDGLNNFFKQNNP